MTGAPASPFTSRGLLADKRVVVTAAAGTGIGFATARRCMEEGAQVVLSDRHEARLAEYADRLSKDSGRPVLQQLCDVTDQGDVDRLFDRAERELGGIDVLVNNAGLGGTVPIAEMQDDEWQRVLDVTLTGTFRCLRRALQSMGSGASIVNVGSVVAWRAEVGQGHYSAAKAGVLALTRVAALEAAPRGVRVNAVVPTLAMHENLARVSSVEHLDRVAAATPFGRPAQPREIANVVVFLASDLSSYMTGESVSVSAQHP